MSESKTRRPRRSSDVVAKENTENQLGVLNQDAMNEIIKGLGLDPSQVNLDPSQFATLIGGQVAKRVKETGAAVSNTVDPKISEAKATRLAMKRHLSKITTNQNRLAQIEAELEELRTNEEHAQEMYAWAERQVTRLEAAQKAGQALPDLEARPEVEAWVEFENVPEGDDESDSDTSENEAEEGDTVEVSDTESAD